MSTVKLNATGMRWVGELADYNFKVKYRPGKTSNDCDFLSRYPTEEVLKSHSKEISLENISSLISRKSAENNWLLVSAVNSNVLEIHLDLSLDYEIKNIYPNLLITEQENDLTISPILNFDKNENKPTFKQKRKLGRKTQILLNYWKKLTFRTQRTYAVRPTHTPKDVRRTFLDIRLLRVSL